MPQILRIGPYSIYFWSNEGKPLEPIHVHISEGRVTSTATKLWITSTGKVILSNNNSQIPEKILRRLMRMVQKEKGVVALTYGSSFYIPNTKRRASKSPAFVV